ncbi:MAG: aspartate aminotransferase family protein [Gammaproteobacteria bacterium]|nr:aspartate aminotransferase family protein [Gammaproteobacteria bacterium]
MMVYKTNPKRNLTLQAALDDAMQKFIADNPLSKKRHNRARQVLPGGNTRSVLHYDPFPLVMQRGSGVDLWDIDGHHYVDFLGEYTAGLFGHSHPAITKSVKQALDDGIVLCAPNQYEAELAAILCEKFPSCDLIRFCNSGTEANMFALNAARSFTGKSEIMVFDGAYHGGVLYFAHGNSPINAPYTTVMGRYNDLDHTLPLIEQHAETLAAILVEPMMGAAGAIPGDPEFLQGLRKAASEHEVVLIFDEVMTSRLSTGGLQLKLGIIPDMTTFGKYIGGGLTVGAFGGREDIMRQFDPNLPDALPHAGTFNNNVLTMAAGVTSLKNVYTPEVAEQHNRNGEKFRQRLNTVIRQTGVAAQVTGVGSIMCIHFQDGPIRTPADTVEAHQDARALLHLTMLRSGYYLAARGFISLSLPLTDKHYDGFVGAFQEFLETSSAVLQIAFET